MEILDREEPVIDYKGRYLARMGLLVYIITGIAALIGLLGTWKSLSAYSSTGAPDAMQLSHGIGISNYAQLVTIPTLIIGVICQSVSSSYHRFHKPWFWRFILTVSISALLASFVPLSLILFIVALISVVFVATNKSKYFDNEA